MIDRHAVSRRARRAVCALVVVVSCAVSGACGSRQSFGPQAIPYPVDPEDNFTPAHTIHFFTEIYEYEDLQYYARLLTTDFRFTFSRQSDSALAAQWGTSWNQADELAAASHLLNGFTNASGESLPPAYAINPRIAGDAYYPDSAHPDSAEAYVFCAIAKLSLAVEFGPGLRKAYAAAPQAFWLVRGDAAHLAPGQPADSLHWYIARWYDLSPAGDPTPPDTSYAPTTWGRFKARYR